MDINHGTLLKRSLGIEKKSHIFWCLLCERLNKGDIFQIVWPSHNVLTLPKKSSTDLKISVIPARKMFPALNNSKNYKNVVSSYGIFIMWAIFYISWVLGFYLSRVGWITRSNATMYLFVTFCCAPVLLSTIYFMRNPKHLIAVLQDQGMR